MCSSSTLNYHDLSLMEVRINIEDNNQCTYLIDNSRISKFIYMMGLFFNCCIVSLLVHSWTRTMSWHHMCYFALFLESKCGRGSPYNDYFKSNKNPNLHPWEFESGLLGCTSTFLTK